MNEYRVVMLSPKGKRYEVELKVSDHQENLTQWVRDQFPHDTIHHIEPKGF